MHEEIRRSQDDRESFRCRVAPSCTPCLSSELWAAIGVLLAVIAVGTPLVWIGAGWCTAQLRAKQPASWNERLAGSDARNIPAVDGLVSRRSSRSVDGVVDGETNFGGDRGFDHRQSAHRQKLTGE